MASSPGTVDSSPGRGRRNSVTTSPGREAVSKFATSWLEKFRTGDERSWGESSVKRIGVPGAEVHLNTRQATRYIFRWRGTAWKAAFTSPAAYLHMFFYLILTYLLVVANGELGANNQESRDEFLQRVGSFTVPPDVINAMTFVFSFVIAQYIAFVVSRYSQRVDVCIATVEAASQVALQSSVLLHSTKRQAVRLVRYTHLVLHLYYLTIDGPMTNAKWQLLQRRRLITKGELAEIRDLQCPESAAFVWALSVVHTAWRAHRLSDDHAVRLETELSAVKRHASSQKDYHESPIPMPFFHLMTVLSHAYLAVLEWNSANRITQAMRADADDAEPVAAAASLPPAVAASPWVAPFLARSPGEIAGTVAGEALGMLTMIVAINCLRRIALAMTNPFGDDETDYDLDYDLRRLWEEAEETLSRMVDDEGDAHDVKAVAMRAMAEANASRRRGGNGAPANAPAVASGGVRASQPSQRCVPRNAAARVPITAAQRFGRQTMSRNGGRGAYDDGEERPVTATPAPALPAGGDEGYGSSVPVSPFPCHVEFNGLDEPGSISRLNQMLLSTSDPTGFSPGTDYDDDMNLRQRI